MMHPAETPETKCLRQVRELISAYDMLEGGEKVLVAVSGGADSVALLRILLHLRDELGITVYGAHLDHQIRGAASQEDAAFVDHLCHDLEVPCTVHSEDVVAFVRREKLSPEEGARMVRYRFLKRVAHQVGAQKIATGHTLDDQAETILYRLFRGTGAKGLGGIPAVREGLFIRPLLHTSRRDIEDYLQEMGQPFRTDTSNADVRFARNSIRHELMPLLKARYGAGVLQRLGRAADIIRDEDAVLDDLSADALMKSTKTRDHHKIVLDIPTLLGYHVAIRRRILRQALYAGTQRALEYEAVERLLQWITSGSDVLSMPAGALVQKHRDLLILKWGAIPAFSRALQVPGETHIPELGATLELRLMDRTAWTSDDWRSDATHAVLDWAAVRGSLVIRSRGPGDMIQPFGMTGHRKIKNILIDRKVPRLLRDEIPVLADDEKVLWMVGIATSEKGRITANTEKILWATFHVVHCGMEA